MRIATKTRVEKEDGRIVSRYPVLKQGGMIRGFAPGTRSSLQLQRRRKQAREKKKIEETFTAPSGGASKMKADARKKKKCKNEIQLKRLAGHFKS